MFKFVQSPKHITNPALTLGVEATRPDTIALCQLGNIDEQHRRGGDGRAAIEVALTFPLPEDGAHLVTDRPDLDSIGAMAILVLRLLGVELPAAARERIAMVAAADSFRVPPVWAPSPLPTAEHPWPSGPAAVSETRALAAMHTLVASSSPQWSVAVVAGWLLGGEPTTWEEMVAARDAWHVASQIAGAVGVDTTTFDYIREARQSAEIMRLRLAATAHESLDERGGVAYVTSELPGAIGLGYCVAPVVVATNPAFVWPGGPVTEKVTIAFYRSPGEERLRPLVDALNAAEQLAPGEGGWGGNLRSGFIGSPQGRAPRATRERIESAVRAVVGGAS